MGDWHSHHLKFPKKFINVFELEICCAQWLTSQHLELFIPLISSSKHTKDGGKPIETTQKAL